jgi:DUF4097 and DUF4098 domain-containing protein YvlB
MRRLLWSAACLLALPLSAQQKLERRIAIAADASIRIYNLAGTTRVTGWERDSIAVTGFAPPGASFFLGGSGRVAKMGLEPDEKAKQTTGGSLEVRVPRGARVWVKSAEGSIEVSGMTGEVDLSTVGGGIKVTGTLRLVTAESMEGDLEVSGASPLVRVKTGGGKILLRQAGGDVIASTVSGPIIASEAQMASARLETVSGPVSYSGTLDRRGTLNIQTHSGDIELLLPTTIGAEFDLASTSGLATVALPAKSGKPLKGRSVFFANAGGGAQIVARSFKGQISVYGQ